MKSIRELRTSLPFNPQEINSSIKFFAENCNIDYNVYLPTRERSLQRDFVWEIEQKREIIWSVLMNRNIPRMSMINTYKDIYEIIDGKQRLSSMIGFFRGEFDLEIDGESYFFDDLPNDYKNVISGFMFPYVIVNEDEHNPISDDDKISWFKYINFAGTPQEAEHLKGLI